MSGITHTSVWTVIIDKPSPPSSFHFPLSATPFSLSRSPSLVFLIPVRPCPRLYRTFGPDITSSPTRGYTPYLILRTHPNTPPFVPLSSPAIWPPFQEPAHSQAKQALFPPRSAFSSSPRAQRPFLSPCTACAGVWSTHTTDSVLR